LEAEMDLEDAVKNGTRREALEALRDELADAIADSPGARDLAALIKQLREVLQEIDDLSGGSEKSHADEIAERRAARRNSA
jgi:hypothetical protein